MKLPHWPVQIGYKDIDLGLGRMFKALEKLGNPHLKLPKTIHFAGTNGKGSTLAFLRAILNDAGYSCHVYTSPHLVEFNERIVLADEIIEDDFLYEILEETRVACKDIKNITFFEGTTLAAILAFSKIKADYVLLETGLGGNLDATNVIPKPELSVITPIAYDHMEFLGDTIEKIAYEKARILKPNCKSVISEQRPEALEVITDYAKEINSLLHLADKTKTIKAADIGLAGEHQFINAATARKAAEVLGIKEVHIKNGIKKAKWPARLEEIKDKKINRFLGESFNVILDGGHNAQAARAIAKFVNSNKNENPNIAIIGMIKTKDAEKFAKNIQGCFEKIYCIQIPEYEDSLEAKTLSKYFDSSVAKNSFDESLEQIKIDYRKANLYICGSLYLAGWVIENLS